MILIDSLGASVHLWGRNVFEFLTLIALSVRGLFSPPFRMREIVRQLYVIANESALIIVFCVCFAAAVIIIEASFHMKLVIQNDAMVPGFAAMLILRELASVVAALLLTSRVGAGIAAEVGTMQITEQIDALKMLGINPVQFLVVPRWVACTVGLFLLSIIANVTCFAGAMMVSTFRLGFTAGGFISAAATFVSLRDLAFASIKGAAFGAVIPLFSCYFGFRCKAGAEGVGFATTNSVVATSICIIVMDFILSWIFANFY